MPGERHTNRAAVRCAAWSAAVAVVAFWGLAAVSHALPRGAPFQAVVGTALVEFTKPCVALVDALLPQPLWGHESVLHSFPAVVVYVTIYTALVGLVCGWVTARGVARLRKSRSTA